MVGIYKIINPKGRVYIGQSIDIEHRIDEYKKLSNCKYQIKLYRSLKKYGVDTHIFEILEECTPNQLNERERYYQDYYDVLGKNGLNCRLTSTNTKSGKNSLESNIKRSKTLSGVIRGPRPDVSERNKIIHSGKVITKEHREAISKKLKGKPHAYKGPRGVSLRIPVLQYTKDRKTLLNEYVSISEAAKSVNRGACDIHRVISGKGFSCAGFWWSYKD